MKNEIMCNFTKRINIYNSKDHFVQLDDKWFLIQEENGEENVQEVTSNDCDIEVLNSGEDGVEVYGFAVFGY